MRTKKIVFLFIIYFCLQFLIFSQTAPAGPKVPMPKIGIEFGQSENSQDVSNTILILIMMTILSIAPGILVMMTAFTRITIILSFTRRALATQQTPSNQVLIGLALFLTFYVMTPVLDRMKTEVIDPFTDKKIKLESAYDGAVKIISKYMIKYTSKESLKIFYKASKNKKPENEKSIPLSVLIPSYIVSELTVAFKIGFVIFIPFLVIDMVVATILMSMGMVMLPPVTISLPFKILLFVMVDGWNLIVKAIMNSYGV